MTNLDRNYLITSAARASVLVAGILIVAKLAAWWVSGSVSLLASLMDSMLDIGASLVNLLAVKVASEPADDDHPFGHGKAEQLAGLAQSAFIAGAALFLVFHAIETLREPVLLDNSDIALWVMGFSMFCTLGLVLFQGWVVRKTRSVAIAADALHYRADLYSNLAIIVAIFLSQQGWLLADGLFAIGIACYMLWGAKEIGWESLQQLMDRSLPANEVKRIELRCLEVCGVLGVHDLKTRQSGGMIQIQLHLDLDGSQSLDKAHNIGVSVKQQLISMYQDQQLEVLIHHDPIQPDWEDIHQP